MIRHQSGRILLVDDEPLVRTLISRYLVAARYVVRTAVDGLDASGKLRAGPVDLIISDLNLARMSGAELLMVVRRRFPQIPVMVISEVPADEIPKEVTADAFYRKNGSGFEQLLPTISDLTRKPPLRTAPVHIDNKPVKARWDGDGHCVVECSDCLRSTLGPRGPSSIRGAHITTCIHCRGVLQLLVDDGDSREGKGCTIPPTGYTAKAA